MKRIGFIIFLLAIICLLYSCGHEHSFSEWSVETEATCSSAGEQIRRCECGEVERQEIAKKEHKIVPVDPIAPTCTDVGYTAGSCCTVCGTYTVEPKPLQPSHNYLPTVVSTPTCTAKGVTRYTCSECSASYIIESEPLEHTIINETCTTPKTCTVCNSTFGSPLGHTIKLGMCERCNEFVQPKIDIPSLPIAVSLKIEGYETELTITELSYRFTGSSIAITYSGIKTKDDGSLNNGRFLAGFSYRLYDAEGNLVASDNASVSNLALGESFRDEMFFIVSLPEISDFYTLVIEDYSV